jgi:HAD superfamily hydrolase (TIGR01509 family)
VFDLDGTLVDSSGVMQRALRATCAAHGQDFATAFSALSAGQGEPLRRIFARVGLGDGAVAMFQRESLEMTGSIPAFAEVLACCERLRADGIRLAVLTGKETRRTEAILERLEIRHMFDPVVCCDSGLRPKPDPAGLLHVLDVHRVPPAAAVFVGDSPIDARTAAAAGVPFVLVTAGQPVGESCDAASLDLHEEIERAVSSGERTGRVAYQSR